MPNYSFECNECHKKYDRMACHDESGEYPTVECPNCNSKSKKKLLTACNFQFAQPEGTSRWISESLGHDYRFKHNIPRVMKERMDAEMASHMGSGSEIYKNYNDENKDAAWGEVK